MQRGRLLIVSVVLAVLAAALAPAASAGDGQGEPPPEVRVATFNAVLEASLSPEAIASFSSRTQFFTRVFTAVLRCALRRFCPARFAACL